MNDNTGKNRRTKIFGIGATGLIGSRITELLSDTYAFTNLSTSSEVDITDPSTLSVLKQDNEHSAVIHFAAKADVDGCEKDKPLGKEGQAWKINVNGVENVLDAIKGSAKKIFYISTDFVFDGENTPSDGYSEDDIPNPVNWYATTKWEGEKAVRASGVPYCILRIAYPYRNAFQQKKDFVHAILGRLQKGEPVKAVTDHIMTPTFVDDIAFALKKLLETDSEGVYHVVGSTYLTPYDGVMAIAGTYDLSTNAVTKTTREEFFAGRAKRPFNLSLKNAKIEKLGVKMRNFEEGLQEIKNHSF